MTTSAVCGPRAVVDVHPAGDESPELLDPDRPVLFIDDLAAVRGDGVFETLMVRDGAVRNLDRHTARFINSSAMLDLPAPDVDRWHAATDLALAHWTEAGGRDGSLRWMYSRGRETTGRRTGWVTVAPESPAVTRDRERGVRVMTAQRGYSLDITRDAAPWALVGAKTLSYAANMAALRYARSHDLDDVIFTGDGERVLEGPTSTVIAVRDRAGRREILTPLHEVGVLPGTTQAAMFRCATDAGWTCSEKPLTIADLREADGVWLLSSVRRYARVTSLDGTVLDRPACADDIEDLATRAAEGR
ncbi:aminodeoxychorismate lyase [uncultured Corynebacterium sp.]|uniref:aminodeoxychorismate lyase n=1 Tax=uncultured Corynebacterium sp. TaxID=159447 RepID=UPI0025D739F6|nr:aminodeoxychorismate lyase [uncultured Corynebacterium sp.]